MVLFFFFEIAYPFYQMEITTTDLSPREECIWELLSICLFTDEQRASGNREEDVTLHYFQTRSVCAALTSTAQNKSELGQQIPKERGGGPDYLAFAGKLSPASEHQEPPYLPSGVLETEAGLHGLVSACGFLELNVLALRPDSEQGQHEWKE